jgi:TonB family protein
LVFGRYLTREEEAFKLSLTEGGADMQPQRFGDYLAVETFSQTSLGEVFKAVNTEGEPRLFLLRVFRKEVSECAPANTLLQAHANKWRELGDLYTLGLHGFGQEQGRLFMAVEYLQGRLLSDVLARCAQEGLPLAHDQAVYLAERIAGALLSLSTQGQFHGALGAEEVLVTFEGEVKLLPGVAKDIQTTALLQSPWLEKYLSCQPPEVRSGKKALESADRFALGALFFEFLSRQPLRQEGKSVEIKARIEGLKKGAGPLEPLPPNLAAIIEKSLLPDAPGTYKSFDEMKADLNQLIASGEYSPSTFNMAFLMHSLFRDEDEPESKRDKEFLSMDRAKFLPVAPEAPKEEEKQAEPAPKPKRKPIYQPSAEPAPEIPAPTFGVEPEPSRKGLYIGLGALALIVVISVLAYFAFAKRGPAEADIRAQVEAQVAAEKAALKKQQDELAAKLAASEKEKQDLEQKMAAATTADEKAKAKKLLEEAKRKVDEQKQAQAQLAEKEKTVQAPSSPASSQPQAPPQQSAQPPAKNEPAPPAAEAPGGQQPASPAAPPEAQASTASTKAGDFVDLFAVDVKPKEIKKLSVEYTPQARANRLSGVIYLEVAVDETGAVTGAKVVKGPPTDYGMGDALVKAAMATRYSPAIKNGVPVKTKITFPVRLEIK